MSKARREAYVLTCDDSGGEDDGLRAVAAVSGPARVMLALERELRQALRLSGVDELKWAQVRTRRPRLDAARTFLDLAAVGLGAGALRVDVLLWAPQAQGKASAKRSDRDRLRPLYAQAWAQAAQAWPTGRWNVYPDQRTGMGWQQWPAKFRAMWRRRGGALRVLKEAASRHSACVQLADLLAGLLRQPETATREHGPGARASRNRRELMRHFMQACALRGIQIQFQGNAPSARHPHLSVKWLKRLPVLA